MNKHIKGWYIAAIGAELVSAAFEAFIFFGNLLNGSSAENAFLYTNVVSIMFCAGVWVPILMGFIGKCLETKLKRLKFMPIAAAIPLVLSVFGILWINTHPRSGFMAGFEDIPRGVFYMICGFISFFSLIFALVHVHEIKKYKYAEFLAMPNMLFEGKSVLLLIPLAVLTLVCLIPASNGYINSL